VRVGDVSAGLLLLVVLLTLVATAGAVATDWWRRLGTRRFDAAYQRNLLRRMAFRDSLGVLRERDFRLLFTGQTLSNLGSALVPIALAFAVLDLTGSATDLGLVLLASRLPNTVLVLTVAWWETDGHGGG
jgi:hypothetical protein